MAYDGLLVYLFTLSEKLQYLKVIKTFRHKNNTMNTTFTISAFIALWLKLTDVKIEFWITHFKKWVALFAQKV